MASIFPSSRGGRRSGAQAAALAGLVATTPAVLSAQSIDLSNIAAGTGPGFVINGQGVSDRSGTSVASAGDVNGDGLADLIVGATSADPPGRYNAGRSYVVFGKTSQTGLELSDVASGSSGLGFVINGQTTLDYSGNSVSSAGDVNGDGLADVIVGAEAADAPGRQNSGRSYVIFGKTSDTAVDLVTVATGTSALGFLVNGQAAYDYSGRSVSSAGDVNGDGLADVIIGALRADPLGRDQAGRSYVVFGKSTGTTVELSAVASGTSTLGFVLNGQNALDFSGTSVSSAGDVNGDGLGDLIVGADASDPPAGSQGGRSYVVFGKTDGSAVDLGVVASGTTALGFVIEGAAGNDRSGRSVSSAGDVNGDGLADLIVGAVYGDPAAGSNAGRSYVVFGKTGSETVSLSQIAVDGSSFGFVINGQASDDRSGCSVSSAGDVNGDGLADVVVGAYTSDPGGRSGAGRSYVVLGKTDGAPVDLSAVATGTSGLGFVLNGQSNFDNSGNSVSSAGDVNGDGIADLIVGARNATIPGRPSAGRSYVVFSPLAPAASAAYRGAIVAGNADRQGIGIHRFGDDETVFPDSRAWLDFDGGSGPGPAGASQQTILLSRSDLDIGGFAQARLANVHWNLATNRTGWNSCRVTLRYTDAEIANLDESKLRLYRSANINGPWVPVEQAVIDPVRNEASGELASLPSYLILVEPGVPTASILRLNQNPVSSDVVDFLVEFSEPVSPSFTRSDVTLNLTGGLTTETRIGEIIDMDPTYVVRVYPMPLDADGGLGISVGPAVSSANAGALMTAPALGPSYIVQRPGSLLGDINLDGTVNVADVTALANHIVNGTPLP